MLNYYEKPPTCATRELHISIPYGDLFRNPIHKLKSLILVRNKYRPRHQVLKTFVFTHRISYELYKLFYMINYIIIKNNSFVYKLFLINRKYYNIFMFFLNIVCFLISYLVFFLNDS
jgi:hypothetical protein